MLVGCLATIRSIGAEDGRGGATRREASAEEQEKVP
jgi:hypothetical protein